MADLCDLEQQSKCYSEDGIEKPPITSKMSIIVCLGESSAYHYDKSGLSKFGVKVQECMLVNGGLLLTF